MESEILPLLEDLYYPSESDEPVELVWQLYTGSECLSPETFGIVFSLPIGIRIVERDPSVFWSNVTTQQEWYDESERDRTSRFIELRNILDANLQNIQYFEVGAIEVTLYYIGRKHDAIQGIRTMAVRT
jgi:hypothetical protein